MAPSQLIRTAKPCNQWTTNDLAAYNITVDHQDVATFFETTTLPEPTIDLPDVPTTADRSNAPFVDTAAILKLLDLAMVPVSSGQSAVNDFLMDLLRALNYRRREWILRTKCNFSPLIVCGMEKRAQVDVSLVFVEQNIALLLIQEVKGDQDPHAPLIAKAIAVFTHNRRRMEAIGLPPPPSMVIPGITLKGTTPTFYKIEVSMELATAVREGVCPELPTIVYAHVPDVPGPLSEGMRPLGNRRVILSCFEAFKKFIKYQGSSLHL